MLLKFNILENKRNLGEKHNRISGSELDGSLTDETSGWNLTGTPSVTDIYEEGIARQKQTKERREFLI